MHRHDCTNGCGHWFTCSSEPDRCPKDYVCDACELDLLDEYWTTHPPQEPLNFDLPELVHTRQPKRDA